MAVANVAVEMGPRNRRRVIKGSIWLGVIAAIVAAVVLLTRPANQSGPGLSAGATQGIGKGGVPSTPIHDKIFSLSFGITKKQVLRRLGPPTKIVGNCWQYTVNEASYTLQQGKVFIDGVENADRLCFSFGDMYTSNRTELNGRWLPPPGRATLPGS